MMKFGVGKPARVKNDVPKLALSECDLEDLGHNSAEDLGLQSKEAVAVEDGGKEIRCFRHRL